MHSFCYLWDGIVITLPLNGAADVSIQEVVVFWTVYMLFMCARMLLLVLQYRLDAISLVIVLAALMAFIKLIRHFSVQLRR